MELRPRADVAWRRVDDDVVLVQLRTNRIYSLNATAARAWELISEGTARTDIERILLEEFDVEAADLIASVEDLLQQLAQAELLAPR